MIILNSVNDYKSLFIKTILEFKRVTYVNLEYAENNNLIYNFDSTSIVFIDSPVNDSERMITKKVKYFISSEEKKDKNIYINSSDNLKPKFKILNMSKRKTIDDDFDNNYEEDVKNINKIEETDEILNQNMDEELVLTDPYIILRFLNDLCEVPTLYPTAMDKRYKIHQFEKKFIADIFEEMFSFEKMLLVSYGGVNGYNFKKLLNIKEHILKNNQVKGKFNKILELISNKIVPYVEAREENKYFLHNHINSIEIVIYSLIKRLIQYNLINLNSINKVLMRKYKKLEELFSYSEEKEHQIINYRNINLNHHLNK